MKDVSDITTCRAYAVRLAANFICEQGPKSVSLKDIKSTLELTENQMYTVRRELNKQHNRDDGRFRYLQPNDQRFVVHVPSDEVCPKIIMAVEAAMLNLSLNNKDEANVKASLTQFLKDQLLNEEQERGKPNA